MESTTTSTSKKRKTTTSTKTCKEVITPKQKKVSFKTMLTSRGSTMHVAQRHDPR